MFINFIFLLVAVGFLSLLLPAKRMKTFWSLAVICIMGYSIFSILSPYPGNAISFVWQAIPNLPVSIELNPWQSGVYGILGVLILHTIAIYYNTISQQEQNPNIISGLLLFNCVFMITAFCSINYIQLLAAVGMADVVVYGMINDLNAKRYYIYGNFIADFVLLNILAIILGQQGKVDITHLEEYTKSWHHRDFIAIMLLAAIFIKSGLAFFHVTYQKIASLSFNRLNFILFASTPLIGLISLLLLNNILTISRYSESLIKIFSCLSIVWGFSGYISSDSLKRKASYNAMLLWGLVYAGYVWLPNFPLNKFFVLLTSAYLFNVSLNIISKDSGDETYISKIAGNICHSKMLFLIYFAAICLYCINWLIFSKDNTVLSLSGLLLIMLITSQTISEIYLNQGSQQSSISSGRLFFISLPVLSFLVAFILHNDHLTITYAYFIGIIITWLLLFLIFPLQCFGKAHNISFIQAGDVTTAIYSGMILHPIQAIGRSLRIAIDFLLVERTIISSIKNSILFFIFTFKSLHNDKIWGKILLIIFGIVLFAATYYKGVAK